MATKPPVKKAPPKKEAPSRGKAAAGNKAAPPAKKKAAPKRPAPRPAAPPMPPMGGAGMMPPMTNMGKAIPGMGMGQSVGAGGMPPFDQIGEMVNNLRNEAGKIGGSWKSMLDTAGNVNNDRPNIDLPGMIRNAGKVLGGGQSVGTGQAKKKKGC